MPEFQTSPGTRDILAPDSTRWRRLVDVFAQVVESAGYGQIIPPMFEDLGVFMRLGEATDIVTKEMYDFEDKGGRHIALRPEQTAGVCRAFAQHRPVRVDHTGTHDRIGHSSTQATPGVRQRPPHPSRVARPDHVHDGAQLGGEPA